MTMQRIRAAGNLLTRRADLDFDQAYKNCYPEMIDQENVFVIKRPGLKASLDFSVTAAGRGAYEWRDLLYTVTGNTLRKGTSTIGTLNSSTGTVYFVETGGGTPKLLIHDGSDIWIIDTSDNMYLIAGGATTYSDWQASNNYALNDRVIPTTENGFFYEATADSGSSAGSEPTWPTTLGDTVVDSGITWTCAGYYTAIPSSFVGGFAFLDQYIFVMNANGSIFNSNVGNPVAWTASDFISAEMRPDAGLHLEEYFNYVVAFGAESIEFFYDAANASGSPLSKVSEAINNVGCLAADSVVSAGNNLYFLGNDEGGGRMVYKMEGLSPQPVSSKPVDRILNSETAIESAYAMYVKIAGHQFYVLTLTGIDKTLVYDMMDNAWHEWTSWNGSTENHFTGRHFTEVLGTMYVQDEDNGEVYELDEDTYQDDGQIIKVQGTTDLWDGGAYAQKFMKRLEVVCDKAASTSTLSISWTDDDYQNFNTARDVDLSGRPMLTRLGSFRRRAFKYTFENNLPMRLEGFEVDVDLGEYGQ